MSLFRVEGATPDENDESTEHSLAARLAAVRATAEEAQTTVDESAAQYRTLIREQVDFHANYVPAFHNDPAFAAAPAPAPGLPAAPAARRGLLCDGDDDDVVPLMEARAPPPAADSESESDGDDPEPPLAARRRRGGVLDDGDDAGPPDEGGAHLTAAAGARGGLLDDGAADAAPAPRRAARGGILDDGATAPAAPAPAPPRPRRAPPVPPGRAAKAPAKAPAKPAAAPAPARIPRGTIVGAARSPTKQAAPKLKPIARRRPLKKPAAAEPRLKGKPTTADRMREAIQTKRVQIAKENLERLLRGEGQPLEKLPPRPKNFRA